MIAEKMHISTKDKKIMQILSKGSIKNSIFHQRVAEQAQQSLYKTAHMQIQKQN